MMKEKPNDPFLKIFSTPQRCDFCMEENQQILTITLHPLFEGQRKEMIAIDWLSANKCTKCIEMQS